MKTVYARDPAGNWRRFFYDDSGKQEPGQEGRVYVGPTGDIAIKVFNQSNPSYLAEKYAKLRTMLQPNLIACFLEERENPDFTWPICTVHHAKADYAFIGYAMRYLKDYVPLDELFANTSAVSRAMGKLDRVLVSAYLSHLFFVCHQRQVLIGDVKPNNIRINSKNPHISIIDCDSFQVRDGAKVYTSNVGTMEYISPRLISVIQNKGGAQSFDGIVREADDDTFALAIICFRVLMGGYHPFRSADVTKQIFENIRDRNFPYEASAPNRPKGEVLSRYQELPSTLRDKFEAVFKNGRTFSAATWRDELHQFARSLEQRAKPVTVRSSGQQKTPTAVPTHTAVSSSHFVIAPNPTVQRRATPAPSIFPPPTGIERIKEFFLRLWHSWFD